MSKIKSIKKKNNFDYSKCYNCGIEITDIKQKNCPNCHVILDPNNYIKWARSFYSCLCLILLIPLFITILIILFSSF